MLFSLALLAASTAVASPIKSARDTTASGSGGPQYGLDPSSLFTITAQSAASGTSDTWTLSAAYGSPDDFFAGRLQLEAVPEGGEPAPSNFTLVATHYGTQLSVYDVAPCTSSAYCNETLVPFPNDAPAAGAPLSFDITNPAGGPSFGGLALYGQWEGSDVESAPRNLITAGGDASFDEFTVCQGATYAVLTYQGANATGDYPKGPCTPVYLLAKAL